jgi:RNA recognition motif-containing protein
MNIYVGNLSYKAESKDLVGLFEGFGKVASAKIIMDRETNRPKGFGFVEMENQGEAEAAISQLNQAEFMGRKLVVNHARQKEMRMM